MVIPRKILVVDSETKVVESIETHLQREGYIVYKAYSAEGASGICSMLEITLIIMEECLITDFKNQILKSKYYDTIAPVIALKEMDDEENALKDIGEKDGYILKPFNHRQLVLKVNSIIKNIEEKKHDIQEIVIYNGDDFYIDFSTNVVKQKGRRINLTFTEYRILRLLATNPNKVFTREEILEQVMKHDYDGYDRVIDSHIKNLRNKIEDNSRNPKYIVTIHKIGYKFIGA